MARRLIDQLHEFRDLARQFSADSIDPFLERPGTEELFADGFQRFLRNMLPGAQYFIDALVQRRVAPSRISKPYLVIGRESGKLIGLDLGQCMLRDVVRSRDVVRQFHAKIP